ncbi:MAG TPA: NAD-dependent epimerase/dehydratase family protein [Patescibacteria group bacterium]|nr:NAD-dependent epimerase/dehydratase family protein [Patescibacteria group bacterium]
MNNTVLLLGCDGYIGNALTQRLLNKGFKVIGVDNFLRRYWIQDLMTSKSATPVLPMVEKISKFSVLGDFIFYAIDLLQDSNKVEELFVTYKPDTIINLAHIPSAPFSQISQEKAEFTLRNNIIPTNNLLWYMKAHTPDAHYITIGTTGEYDHYSNIDIEEGYIKINHKGRMSNEMIYPRRPGSLYHCSKTASTYIIDFLTRTWGLRCTDVQQSVVFGSYTDEIDKTKVYSRLDSDEAGGTVINRFIVQTLLGIPMTVYGEGLHQRGFISLNDSVQALEIAVNNPPAAGKVQVWNQLSEWHSIIDITKFVEEVATKLGIPSSTQHIPSPRNEYTGEHYYNYVVDILPSLGYTPTRSIKQEIEYTMVTIKDIVPKELKSVVMPKILWEHKK